MNNLPSFTKSIIIPLELYEKKCKNFSYPEDTLPKQKHNLATEILATDLPSDLKLKLFDQYRNKPIQSKTDNYDKTVTPLNNYKESIYNLFPEKDQDHIKDIFKLYIERNPDIIDWNRDTHEVILEEKTLKNTDLIQILQYLLNPQGKQKPLFSYQTFLRLIEIGVPSNWFATTLQLGIPQDRSASATSTPSRLQTPLYSTPRSWSTLVPHRRRRLPFISRLGSPCLLPHSLHQV
jgi:hypothetical protein